MDPFAPARDDLYDVRSQADGPGGALPLTDDLLRHAPSGTAGGASGAPGLNQLNGRSIPAKCRMELEPGDVVTVMTPGGGGWGTVGNRE